MKAVVVKSPGGPESLERLLFYYKYQAGQILKFVLLFLA